MTFEAPLLLWLLAIPLLLALLGSVRPPRALSFPGAGSLAPLEGSRRGRLSRLAPWIRTAALLFACAALARPQLVDTVTTVTSRGVDIALALDLSSSMLAVDRGGPDRSRSRLSVAKELTREFVARRGGDRVALVAFGGRAYPVAPLTLDHDFLAAAIGALEAGEVEDGTALGEGLLAAVNRLRLSPAASRTAVLVTDGRSNAGRVTPSSAASVAAALGIRVHAIGIGGSGGALFPVEDPLGGVMWRTLRSDLDEPALREIASLTGGSYFRADGPRALQSVFLEIDRLERRRIEEKRRTVTELFPHLAGGALLLLMLEQLLICRGFRSIP